MELLSRPPHCPFRTAGLLLVALLGPGGAAGTISAWQTISDPLTEARQQWLGQLGQLQQEAGAAGWAGEQALANQLAIDPRPGQQTIFLPPAEDYRLPGTSDQARRAWRERLQELRQQHATVLGELAGQRAEQGQGAAAYQMLHEALVADPGQTEIRRVLGFRQDESGSWSRTARPIVVSAGRTRQKTIGWARGTYHVVTTPHFRIYTVNETAGRELAARLERVYDVWRQVYFDFWSTPARLQSWLTGRSSDGSGSRRHDVILFRDRDHYLAELADVQGVELSTGYYNDGLKTSFFYSDDPPPRETWSHEIVHQLLQEASGNRKTVADAGHAWLVEGIAMYFESLRDRGNHATIGGPDTLRLQHARLRFLREGFFVPLLELDGMNREQLQRHPDVRGLYSQSAGIAQYLFLAGEGARRDNLIRFVRDFYRGRSGPGDLAGSIGALDQIDRGYQAFLVANPDDLPGVDREIEGLSLAQSGVRDEQLAPLAECRNLDWLHLSENSRLTNDGLKHIARLPGLTRLMVDATHVTDPGLEILSGIKTLQRLDIASNRISDEGLRHVAGLPNLEVLWLGGTPVTDAGLQHLESLDQLQYLDLRQTAVTEAGIRRLRERRPDLQIER